MGSSRVLDRRLVGRGLEVGAEAVQSTLPKTAPLGDPSLGEPQGSRLDPAGAGSPHLLGSDKPARLEDLDVLQHSGQRHGKRLAQLAHRCRTLGQAGHDQSSAWVREGPEYPVEFDFVELVKH